MTFSEFIDKCSYADYISYCNKQGIPAVFDIKLEPPKKLCWLVESAKQKTLNQNKRKNNAYNN